VCARYREFEHLNLRAGNKHRALANVAVKEEVLGAADAPWTIILDDSIQFADVSRETAQLQKWSSSIRGRITPPLFDGNDGFQLTR
jgi:hypothetical protein